MKDEKTAPTDLSGATDEIKAQILENAQKLKNRDSVKRTTLVYICSPCRGDIEKNLQKAQSYCREVMTIWPEVLPIAPHVYFTQFLDDADEDERNLGMAAALSLLNICDEVWVYGMENPSSGMASEIAYAEAHGIPVYNAADVYRNRPKPDKLSRDPTEVLQ